jgi:phospholipase C
VALLALTSCELTPADWGFEAIRTMKTPADPPLVCDVTVPVEHVSERAACTFKARARAGDTLGISAELSKKIPIRHVIVVMLENRSFDHLFGRLHDQGQPESEEIPGTYFNRDLYGVPVAPFHATTTCIDADPGHQSMSMLTCVNGGAMDGFVRNAATTSLKDDKPFDTDGHYVMATYEQADLPFYYWVASTYALSDRHFAPMVSGTFGNRNFFMFGSPAGVVDSGISFPDPSTNSIFRELMSAGFTWGAYSDDEAGPLSTTLNWKPTDPGAHPIKDIYDALDHGTLPSVAFVDATEEVNDDHPVGDLHHGEKFLKDLHDHATASPQWGRLAIFWTYDEGGGFPDHVRPPKGCEESPGSPYTDLGVRVPLVAISPWAKKNSVSHVPHDHTAITRFIETVFDLPAMTARDANSDALMDMFDFSCGRDLTPPAGAPAPGTGQCDAKTQ